MTEQVSRTLDPANYLVAAVLRSGTPVVIRSIRSDDKDRMIEAFNELEPETIYTRFFAHKKYLSEQELTNLTEVDFVDAVALVATLPEANSEIIIGAGRYVGLSGTLGTSRVAELAFTVEEDYQGQGLAGMLLHHLVLIGRRSGLVGFEAEVLSTNVPMLRVFARSGLPMRKRVEGRVMRVTLSLDEEAS